MAPASSGPRIDANASSRLPSARRAARKAAPPLLAVRGLRAIDPGGHMRMPIVIWVAVILACGTGRNANQNTDGGSGGGGPTLHTLIVAVSGSGKITSAPAGIDCGVSCSSRFDAGTEVALTASAAAGWKFAGWSGACSGDQACSLRMDDDVMVIATFSQVPQNTDSLSVVVEGTGSGRVTSSPAGIDCPGTCRMT